jgi:hypothetical protein
MRERIENAMTRQRRWIASGCAVSAICALSACGPVAVDHTPTGNILDVDTQSFEGGVGHWQAWYSTDIERSTEAAQRGLSCLRIEITALFGWGVQLDNWPGFHASPGPHRAELWARAVSGSALTLTASIHSRNESGDDLQSSEARMPLERAWRKLGRDFTAPPGTARIFLELTGADGEPGDAIQVDEIFVL